MVPSDANALAALFREALAWGKVYGAVLPEHQWDEMRETMVAKFVARQGAQSVSSPTPPDSEGQGRQMFARGWFAACQRAGRGDLSTCIGDDEYRKDFAKYDAITNSAPQAAQGDEDLGAVIESIKNICATAPTSEVGKAVRKIFGYCLAAERLIAHPAQPAQDEREAFTDDDMAAVGRALMAAVEAHAPDDWHPADCPSEIVGDLRNMLDEARAALSTPPMSEDQINAIMDMADTYADSTEGQPVTCAENRIALLRAIAAMGGPKE